MYKVKLKTVNGREQLYQTKKNTTNVVVKYQLTPCFHTHLRQQSQL